MTYTIEKSGITLDFSTWALSKFCEHNGNISVTELIGAFQQLTIPSVASLMYWAARNHHRRSKAKGEFIHSEDDAFDWIDDLGGIYSDKIIEMFGVVTQTISPTYQGADVQVEEGLENEKKSQLAGTTSELVVSEPV